MSDNDLKTKRTDIYPFNKDKAELLAKSLKMSITEMINYLIETADVQQLTKITFENKKTNRKFSTIRSSENYNPKEW